MWIIFIFILLVQGAICYHLAGNKRKDKGLAFLMGCIFGIFAIFYYGVCGKGGVPCPYCKELVAKDAIICPHCQKEIKPVENKGNKSFKLKR